jgi:hypothetical protein
LTRESPPEITIPDERPMTDTSGRFAGRFGSRTGEFALIVAGTVLLGLAFPGAGLRAASAARRARRARRGAAFSGPRARTSS